MCTALSFSAFAKEPAAPPKLTIDPSKTAFMLLHWQNDLVSPEGKFAGPLPKFISEAHNIQDTVAALKDSREKGMMVIYVNLSYRPGYPELVLRNKGIKNLVLTGMCTNFVVESTAREAMNRCFSAIVLKNCCNSFSREMHDWSIKTSCPVLPRFQTQRRIPKRWEQNKSHFLKTHPSQ